LAGRYARPASGCPNNFEERRSFVAVAKARDSDPSTTPAEVGKRVMRGVFQRRVGDDRTEELNNAMHAVYGTASFRP
jgi:hypothetical protein